LLTKAPPIPLPAEAMYMPTTAMAFESTLSVVKIAAPDGPVVAELVIVRRLLLGALVWSVIGSVKEPAAGLPQATIEPL